MADIKREDVLMYLENANMLEISELIKDIEDKFGVTAAVPVAIAGGAAPVAGDTGADEEQSEFDVEELFIERSIKLLALAPAATHPI